MDLYVLNGKRILYYLKKSSADTYGSLFVYVQGWDTWIQGPSANTLPHQVACPSLLVFKIWYHLQKNSDCETGDYHDSSALDRKSEFEPEKRNVLLGILEWRKKERLVE